MTRIILQLVMLIPTFLSAPMNFLFFWSMLLSGDWFNRGFSFFVFWIIGLIGLIVSIFFKSNKGRTFYINILYAALLAGVLAEFYIFASATFLSGNESLPFEYYYIFFITKAGPVIVAVWNFLRLRKSNS